MYLTLKDCALLADNMNVSSARYYKDTYLEYFDTQGEGKTTKFEEHSTIELLKLIKAAYVKKLDHSQIIELLNIKRGFIPSNSITQVVDNTTETTQQEDLTHSIRLMLQQELNKRDKLILELQEEIQSIKEILLKQDEGAEDRSRSSEFRDRDILQRINEIRAEQQQRNKPWWKRFSRT